jgi:altronate hydrolase
MDINCGEVIDGTASIQELGQRLFQMMLDAASGKKTKSEQHGYGQNEFVPWQISVYT